MAEIEVIKTYRVGNELFNTQEEAEGFPTPIVYDNTDVAKKIDFNEFRKGHRE